MIEKKKEKRKKKKEKKWFVEDVKMPTEACTLCTIDGDTFYLLMKNTWFGDSGASCHITNDDICLFDVIGINELIQGNARNVPATKKGKLHVQQVDGTKWVHTLWPVKFCPKVGTNLLSLMYEPLQGNIISSDHWNSILVKPLMMTSS